MNSVLCQTEKKICKNKKIFEKIGKLKKKCYSSIPKLYYLQWRYVSLNKFSYKISLDKKKKENLENSKKMEKKNHRTEFLTQT